MKRTFRFGIILLLTAVFISACSFGKVPEIDEYTWVIWSVQNNDDGQIAAVSSDSAEYFDCDEIIEVTCTAKDGEITFTDSTNDKAYSGTYVMSDNDVEARLYTITIDDEEILVTVSKTTYQDNSERPTMIVTTDDYSITFYNAK